VAAHQDAGLAGPRGKCQAVRRASTPVFGAENHASFDQKVDNCNCTSLTLRFNQSWINRALLEWPKQCQKLTVDTLRRGYMLPYFPVRSPTKNKSRLVRPPRVPLDRPLRPVDSDAIVDVALTVSTRAQAPVVSLRSARGQCGQAISTQLPATVPTYHFHI